MTCDNLIMKLQSER